MFDIDAPTLSDGGFPTIEQIHQLARLVHSLDLHSKCLLRRTRKRYNAWHRGRWRQYPKVGPFLDAEGKRLMDGAVADFQSLADQLSGHIAAFAACPDDRTATELLHRATFSLEDRP